MTLDEVMRDIVYNKDIQTLLKKPDLKQPYGEIAQFQIDECEDNDTSIEDEGFQIGEPFDGDIENAPVLFLSSNPAFNFDEVSPRYFHKSGKVFLPERIDATRKAKISDGEYSLDEIIKMLTIPQKEFSFEEIKNFLKTRIQTSPARNNRDRTLRIPLRDGGTIGVPYWTCVRNNTELLLPSDLTASWTKLSPSQKAREVMKYVVCMEIVPFRSNSEVGVDNAKDTCWNNFTKHLLELSGAPVIVLVGNKVLDSFVSHVASGARGTLEDRKVYSCKIGDKDRQIVKVDFAQGKIRRFEKFFDNDVITQLQKAVKTFLN
ncbi:MAG: hypothetical protein IJ859_03135 [Synergistaceae bacterium]|nr:hypothetical protein [Synergistaceae bacterium]